MDENAQIYKIKKLFYLQFLNLDNMFMHIMKCFMQWMEYNGNACNVMHRKKGMQCN